MRGVHTIYTYKFIYANFIHHMCKFMSQNGVKMNYLFMCESSPGKDNKVISSKKKNRKYGGTHYVIGRIADISENINIMPIKP